MAQNTDFNLLRSLEIYLAIIEHGQMKKAAIALGITQSAISQHLSNLETLYKTNLLDRQQRPLRPTLTGIALQQHASDILSRVSTVTTDLQQIENTNIPLLRVAILPSLATILTPLIVSQASSLYRISSISIYADLANQHGRLIHGRQADLLVTSDPFLDLEGLCRKLILTEEFLLILPKKESTAVKNLVKLSQRLPFIRFSPSTPVGIQIDRHLRRCQIELSRQFDADRTTMILASVAAGLGFSIMSPTLLLDGIIEGMELNIVKLPVKPLTRSIMLVHRDGELDQLPELLTETISAQIKRKLLLLDPVAQQSMRFDSGAE